MLVKSRLRLLSLFALLVATAIQGLTPDFGSVASTRLFLIVETLAEGEETDSHSCVYECCIDIHIQDSLPPGGSPFKDSNEEDSPDEVCLAVQTLAPVCPVNQLRKSYRSNHIPFDGPAARGSNASVQFAIRGRFCPARR